MHAGLLCSDFQEYYWVLLNYFHFIFTALTGLLAWAQQIPATGKGPVLSDEHTHIHTHTEHVSWHVCVCLSTGCPQLQATGLAHSTHWHRPSSNQNTVIWLTFRLMLMTYSFYILAQSFLHLHNSAAAAAGMMWHWSSRAAKTTLCMRDT